MNIAYIMFTKIFICCSTAMEYFIIFFVQITECDLKNEMGKKGILEMSPIFDGVFFKRSQYDLYILLLMY